MEVNVHEARTHLCRLLKRVACGEDIVISKAGVPVARLVAIEFTQSKRQLGIDEGKIWMADDFDAPSPDIEASFAAREKPLRKRARRK